MPLECLDGCGIVISKLTIGTVAYACALAIIPDIAIARVSGFACAFGIIISPAAAIAGGPGLLDEIGSIGSHAPVVAIGANLGIYIKIIHQYKLPGNGMQVGCHMLAENTQ